MARNDPNFIAFVLCVAATAGSAAAQCDPPPPLVQFTGLGVLPGGYYSEATAISADGTVVVGNAISVAVGSVAFRWTRAGGMQGLGTLPGDSQSMANAVNSDGSLIVGDSSVGNSNYRPFRWTAAGGIQDFAVVPPGTTFSPRAISADASVAAGNCGIFHEPAARWTAAGGVESLPNFPANWTYSANGISADGSVIIGDPAFRWTAASGFEVLNLYQAHAVTPDGTVIVGGTYTAPGNGHLVYKAYKWTLGSGVNYLGLPEEYDVFRDANAVNADGSVVVGVWGQRPLLWTDAMGALDLSQYLLAHNANLSSWVLGAAVGVSADGTTYIGNGTHMLASGQERHEAWVATTAMLLVAQPTDRTSCQGRSESFSVRLVGTTPRFAFTWRKNGIVISGGNALVTTAPDGRGSTLTLLGIGAADQAFYDCAIGDGSCRYIQSAPVWLTVNSADFDGDGDLGTDADIEAFFACLAGQCCPACGGPDFNADGDIGTDADIESFFRVLAGGNC